MFLFQPCRDLCLMIWRSHSCEMETLESSGVGKQACRLNLSFDTEIKCEAWKNTKLKQPTQITIPILYFKSNKSHDFSVVSGNMLIILVKGSAVIIGTATDRRRFSLQKHILHHWEQPCRISPLKQAFERRCGCQALSLTHSLSSLLHY